MSSSRPLKRLAGGSPPTRKKKQKRLKLEQREPCAHTPAIKSDVFNTQAGPSGLGSLSKRTNANERASSPAGRGLSVGSQTSDDIADDEQHETWDHEVDAELANYSHFGLRKGTPLEGLSHVIVLQAVIKAGGTKSFTDGGASRLLVERPDIVALLSQSWMENKGYRAVREHGNLRLAFRRFSSMN
jgi:hypothetical protein